MAGKMLIMHHLMLSQQPDNGSRFRRLVERKDLKLFSVSPEWLIFEVTFRAELQTNSGAGCEKERLLRVTNNDNTYSDGLEQPKNISSGLVKEGCGHLPAKAKLSLP
jgi:hypothetical protein